MGKHPYSYPVEFRHNIITPPPGPLMFPGASMTIDPPEFFVVSVPPTVIELDAMYCCAESMTRKL